MIITLIFRAAQLLFAAVVIALSAVLINGYGPGHNPSIIDYGAFCGGASLILAVVGVVAMFFDALKGIVILALDGLASFFLLAGGIAFAVTIKTGSCTNDVYLANHFGTFNPSDDKDYGTDNQNKAKQDRINDIENRCRMIQADTAFVWFLAGAFLVTLALSFMQKTTKHGGSMA